MFELSDREEFLSEEDLAVGEMPWPERIIAWNAWLSRMQATNDEDKDDYSHGVFLSKKQQRELWGKEIY